MIMEIFGSDSDSLADILNGIDDEFLQYNCLQQIIKTQNNNRRNSNHNSNNDNLIMMNGNDDDDDDDNGFHNYSMHMHSGNNIDNNNNNNNNNSNVGQNRLTPSLYTLYIKLLCQFDKTLILPFLKDTDGYALDDACKENNVIDAIAY